MLHCFLSKFISFPSWLPLHLEIFQPTFTYKCEFFKIGFYWHSYTGKHSYTSAFLSVQVGIAVSTFKFQLIAKITEEEKKTFNMHKAHILSCCIYEYLKHKSLSVALPNPQGMLHTRQTGPDVPYWGLLWAPGTWQWLWLSWTQTLVGEALPKAV